MAIKHPKRGSSSFDGEVEINNQNDYRKNEKAATVLHSNALNWRALSQQPRVVGNRYYGSEPINLEKRIQKKIIEIVEKEEILVDLYKKAAEAAKKKEEEFKDKTAMLMTQIEKDKDLIKLLKRVN